ncbi:hypothetical protein HHI36_005151, partial [Cryptolaemus montrouzieri]
SEEEQERFMTNIVHPESITTNENSPDGIAIWKIIKDETNSGRANQDWESSLVAEELNDYFASIGKSIQNL